MMDDTSNLRPSQQPSTQLEPEQFEALWRTCITDDPSEFARYIASLLPVTPSVTTLEYCLLTALKNGPHHTMMQHLITHHRAPVTGNTLIQAACLDLPSSKKKTLLEFLFKKSELDVNAQVDGKNTLLYYCVKDAEMVQHLINLGANPNLGPKISGELVWGADQLVEDSGANLAAAIHWGSAEAVDVLIRHGAVLENACPIHCAVERGHKAMLVQVLGLGAKVDEKDSYAIFGRNSFGTSLVRAVKKNKVELVKVLLDHGASVHGKGWDGVSVMESMKIESVDQEIKAVVMAAWAREG